MIRLAAMLAVILLAASHVRAQDQPAEPEGYRTEDYRTAVPATLGGARVLTTAEAAEIWRNKSGTFVDVLPRAPKPNLPAGTVWRERPHRDIPGSIWLPDTGYGKLAASTEDYMRRGLVRASEDDRARLLVIYCQENCWMSWNAAKRVLTYGYRNVAWYPEGTDGWERANLPLADAEPEPREGEQ